MTTESERINILAESIKNLQAENFTLKHFLLAMYAQEGDINNTMKHFMASCEEIDAYNTFSTLPEDFVSEFRSLWKQFCSSANLALSRSHELRTKE